MGRDLGRGLSYLDFDAFSSKDTPSIKATALISIGGSLKFSSIGSFGSFITFMSKVKSLLASGCFRDSIGMTACSRI